MLTPGSIVDRWHVEGLIGRGGVAHVYRVRDRDDGSLHVLKVLTSPDATGRARLLREGQVQGRLVHPNIVEVTDVVDVGEAPALLMELVEGPSLAQVLQQGRLPMAVIDALLPGICEGLAAAHAAGAVHRDLKPANVLLHVNEGRVVPKVADFGLVKQLGLALDDAQTGSGATLGTPQYMAPEQVRGTRDVDRRADVWALGVMLYEMATGQRPFRGPTPFAIYEDVVAGRFTAPEHLQPDLPPRALAAIDACLRPWADRASSVAEIRALWGGDGEAAMPAGWAQRLRSLVAELPDGAEDTWVAEITSHTHLATASGQDVLGHLPKEPGRFVGRRADLEALAEALARGERRITVQGFGGAGKTRLALRVAWRHQEAFPGGAWFGDLTEARDRDDVVRAVATGLRVPLGKGDPVEQLADVLRARGRCLLLLDNAEQVAGDVADLLQRWGDSEATMLVTSRERLQVPGEWVHPLGALSRNDAVALFIARASEADPGFALREDERPHVEALVDLIDGLPLAIELAAARSRVFRPEALLARMSERFRLLSSTGTDRPDRHRSLLGVLQWSWDLLSEDERSALAQLSVFDGGFTMAAAEDVLALPTWWAADALDALLDRSLVQRLDHGRLGLLTSVKAFAAMQLDDLGLRDGAERRHAQWFARFGTDDALDGLDRVGGALRRAELARELPNLQAACRRAIPLGRTDDAVALLRATWAVLELTGPGEAVLALADRIAQQPGLADRPRLQVADVRAGALRFVGRLGEARGCLDDAIGSARSLGERRLEATLLSRRSVVDTEGGDLEAARDHGEAALALARDLGDRRVEGIVLGNLGIVDVHQARLDDALAHFEGALAAHRDVGNRLLEGNVLGNLGAVRWHQGRSVEARALYEAALAVHREVGNRRSEGNVRVSLGILHWRDGRPDEARRCYLDALKLLREVHHRRGEGNVLSQLGILDAEQGRFGDAKAHFEAALALHRTVGNRRLEAVVLGNLGDLYASIDQWSDARAHYERALELATGTGFRIVGGKAHSALGWVAFLEGRHDDAHRAYDEAATLLQDAGDLQEQGLLACRRSQLAAARGERTAAERALAEAEALGQQLDAGPDTSLGRAVAEARTALSADW